MRVVSGKAKGRKLLSVQGTTTRPITDRVKTALFDTIRPTLPGARVLDLFAGTGAVGIEAISQGALHCTFIDISREAVRTILENLSRAGLSEQADVRQMDAFRFIKNTDLAFDLIYIAPPQYKNLWLEALHAIAERPERLSKKGRIIVQIDPTEREEPELRFFHKFEERKYGSTLLMFYSNCIS